MKLARKLGAAVATAGSTLLAMTVTAAPAHAAQYNTEFASVGYADLCLDAYGAAPITAGTPVQVYWCNGGTNQKWNIMDDGTIRSAVDSDLCLDINGATTIQPGSGIQLWWCNGGKNQMWATLSTGHGIELNSAYDIHLCADIYAPNGSYTAGTKVQAWTCNNGLNQAWAELS